LGSSLSPPPVVADLILQNLESSILSNLMYKPIFYYRYVDDIALSVPFFQLNSLLEKFNSFHHKLKFTMEVGGEGDRLNFLDPTIIKQYSYFRLVSETNFLG